MFKSDMIQAIVDGKKTQTRRLSGLKEINQNPGAVHYLGINSLGEYAFELFLPDGTSTLKYIKPRYHVGEGLYLKETWRIFRFNDVECSFYVEYRDGGIQHFPSITDEIFDRYWRTPDMPEDKWRSPLFMPAWSARYFIRITGVRVERLQTITPEDCYAEGVGTSWAPASNQLATYSRLWDSLYPEFPWATSPWVWVYGFEKAERPEI